VISDGERSVTAQIIEGWWKDTGRLEDILEANRIMLDALVPRNEGELGEDVRIDGRVVIEAGARLHDCVVRGPAIIGKGALIANAYVGPFTSIHDGCIVRNAEVEHSIVLENTVIENVSAKIESSLIGRECVVRPSPLRPRALKLMLGDHSRVELL
jgi:glucose-1-phosphate thymidylyltransferase